MIREKWIDNAKGIAMLLVIIGHTSGQLSGRVSFHFVYGVHLVMFFLLSGYTLRKKEITREYLNARFSRLMVPYFYTCGTIMLTDIISSHILDRQHSIQSVTGIISRDLLRGFFASGGHTDFGAVNVGTRIGAIWFLPALFFALLLFQFMLQKTEDDRILGVCTGALAMAGVMTGKFLWLPFSIQSGMLATFFLWIGYEVKKHDLLSRVRWYHYFAAHIILLFGIFDGYCGISFVNASLNDDFISIPVGLSGCLLIYLLAVNDRRGFILSWIGRISLTVLCAHLYAMETMWPYFKQVLDRMGLSGNAWWWGFVLLHILFACLIAAGIEWMKKAMRPRHARVKAHCEKDKGTSGRYPEIDVARGIFMCAMLVGHFSIEGRLRTIIYSCHMIAFVLLSGYFYNSDRPYGQTVKRMIRTFLLPYAVCVASVWLLNRRSWSLGYLKDTIITYLLGMSFSRRVLSDAASVGPVYFILLLFLTRLIYMTVDRLAKDRKQLTAMVFLISIFGLTLGKHGWWLPWSLDVACYALVFYHIGRIFREQHLIERVRKWHVAYFILSPVWAYMIYNGGMEIAARNYGNYGRVVLGATAGVLVVYQFSACINDHWPVIALALRRIGECSVVVLIVHKLLGSRIGDFVAMRFTGDHIAFMAGSILIQLGLSIAVSCVIDMLKGRRLLKRMIQ